MTQHDPDHHTPFDPSVWQGREDDDGPSHQNLRWHHAVQEHAQLCQALSSPNVPQTQQRGVVLLGFAVDEGVRRNQGRQGAAQGPLALRKALTNIPLPSLPAGEHWLTKPTSAKQTKNQQQVMPLLQPEPPLRWIADVGDICCPAEQLETAQQALSESIARVLDDHGHPHHGGRAGASRCAGKRAEPRGR